jgi:hypothetical protein
MEVMWAGPSPCRLAGGAIPAKEAVVGLSFRPRRPLTRLAAGAATTGIADRPGQPPPPQPTYAPPPDSIAELERLARLHESGALTDQEFTAAKVRALGL